MSHITGIIALDIDGTITAEHHTTPQNVVQFLGSIERDGWRLIFITGRTFQWGFRALKELNFPYHFAVNNGALMLEMPSRNIVKRKYLSRAHFPKIERICEEEGTDFVLYGGYEVDDRCFYRPQKMKKELVEYLRKRCLEIGEIWTAVGSFDEVPYSEFASIKCFAKEPSASRLSAKIQNETGLYAPFIRDPYCRDYYVIQGTHPHVSKGDTVEDFRTLTKSAGIVIAAGDDNNDLPMLQKADIKVVMASAPQEMLAIADIVAPPATEYGIIAGLKTALARREHG